MASRISILPEQVINQIAAGEVIENPASAIKELVENSLDAKAKNIRVEIKNGGMFLIRVEDDGDGMNEHDVKLAILRHATSKITKFDDIFSLNTMGFRGEALASIAAISKMRIISKTKTDPAISLTIEGGQIKEISSAAREKGTTIDVRSLFYTAPVRKKFQKSLRSIEIEIRRGIHMLALAHPETNFSLSIDEKQVFKTTPSAKENYKDDFQWRLQDVMGGEFIKNSFFFEHKDGPYKAFGYVAGPAFVKKNRGSQHIFVNRRGINSFAISKFVKEAFATRINESEYPQFVLFLDLPGEDIDVNVHPQKKEIRLKNEYIVRKVVISAIEKAFSFQNEKPNLDISFSSFSFPQVEKKEFTFKENNTDGYRQENLFEKNSNVGQFEQGMVFDNLFLIESQFLPNKKCVVDDMLTLIDLKSAESILLFKNISQDKKNLQQLALPISIELSKEQVITFEQNQALIEKIGFEAHLITDRIISVDAIREEVKGEDVSFLMHSLLSELKNCSNIKAVEELANLEIMKKMAINICRFIRSKKEKITKEKACLILTKLFTYEDILFDPLGRTAMIFLDRKEIENLFWSNKAWTL